MSFWPDRRERKVQPLEQPNNALNDSMITLCKRRIGYILSGSGWCHANPHHDELHRKWFTAFSCPHGSFSAEATEEEGEFILMQRIYEAVIAGHPEPKLPLPRQILDQADSDHLYAILGDATLEFGEKFDEIDKIVRKHVYRFITDRTKYVIED